MWQNNIKKLHYLKEKKPYFPFCFFPFRLFISTRFSFFSIDLKTFFTRLFSFISFLLYTFSPFSFSFCSCASSLHCLESPILLSSPDLFFLQSSYSPFLFPYAILKTVHFRYFKIIIFQILWGSNAKKIVGLNENRVWNYLPK